MGLSAYSRIALADGSEKRIEDLEVGDRILDPNSGTRAVVRNLWQGPGVGMISIAAGNGETLDLTGDQLLLTDKGMVPAAGIRAGARLRTFDGWTTSAKAAPLAGDFMVYDVDLKDGGKCVLANGIIVGWA